MLPILPLVLSLAPEIARWIGGGQAAGVTSAVADAVRAATGTDDPEAAARTLAADPVKTAELRVQLAKISADAEAAQRQADLDTMKLEVEAAAARQQKELEALKASLADVGSARQQTMTLAASGSPLAWGAPILSAIILVAFAVMLYVVIIHGVQERGVELANVLLGTLAAMATQVATYWLGSSNGSRSKDEALQRAQEQLSRSVPASILPRPSAVVPAEAIPDGDLATDALNRESLARARAMR